MSLSEQNLSALEASSFPSTPAGKPRLNQRERHLHRLYEPLTLLSTLIHGQQACEPKSASELRREGVYKPWHRYVDQLCWLCDFECGGKSIASIAVQASSPGPVYWLAINKKFAAKALSYLEWILSELAKLHGLSSDQQQRVEAEIVARSIEMSSDRVKNYGKWLCNAIQEVLEKWSLQIDARLREDLQSLMLLQDQHQYHDLCRLASQLPSLRALEDQCQKSTTSTGKEEWSKIRHCIGRLGSWSRAARVVVHVAKTHPHIVSKYRVEYIHSVLPVEPPTADQKTNFREVIRNLLPKHESQSLGYIWDTLNFAEEFRKRYTQRSSTAYPHSEIVSLEHFYINRLKFFGNEKYIGCSKPSCYCCQLYMKFHPGEFVPRPSHGNLWGNWNIPSLVVEGGGKIMLHAKHTLARMAQHLRDEALVQMTSRLPYYPRMPDSTTGLSPIPALSKLGLNQDSSRHDGRVDFDDIGGTDEFENEESSDGEDWT